MILRLLALTISVLTLLTANNTSAEVKNLRPGYERAADELALSWRGVNSAVAARNTVDIRRYLERSQQFMVELGIYDAPQHAQELINLASAQLVEGGATNLEIAQILLAGAKEISPRSPWVAIKVAELERFLGHGTYFNTLLIAWQAVWDDSEQSANFLLAAGYPVIRALIIAFFLLVALFFREQEREAMHSGSRVGIAFLVGLFVVVAVVTYLVGPLWSILVLSVALTLPRIEAVRTSGRSGPYLALAGGLLLIFIGAMTPLLENARIVNHNPIRKSAIALGLGDAARELNTPEEVKRLCARAETLSSAAGQSDPLLLLMCSRALLRIGETELAKLAAEMAKAQCCQVREAATVQLANTKLIGGDLTGAAQLLRLIPTSSANYPVALINLSKIEFAATRTKESEDLIGEAYRIAPQLVTAIRQREEIVGGIHPGSLAQAELSVWDWLKSLSLPQEATTARADAKIAELMRGIKPPLVVFAGVLAVLIALVRLIKARRIPTREATRRRIGWCSRFDWLLPGAILLSAEREIVALLAIFLLVLLTGPWLSPDPELTALAEFVPQAPYLLLAIAFLFYVALAGIQRTIQNYWRQR